MFARAARGKSSSGMTLVGLSTALLTLIIPIYVRAQEDPLQAFPNRGDSTKAIIRAIREARDLRKKGLDEGQVRSSLARTVPQIVRDLLNLTSAPGTPLTADQKKAVDAIVEEAVTGSLISGSEDAPLPPSVRPEPSDRIKKNKTEPRLRRLAVNEYEKLVQDKSLDDKAKRERLVEKLTNLGIGQNDMVAPPGGTGPPKEDELKFFASIADDAIAGIKPPPPIDTIGLDVAQQKEVRHQTLLAGLKLSETVSPATQEEFNRKLRPKSEEEFRKAAGLAAGDELKELQKVFVDSVVEQVRVDIGRGRPRPETTSGLSSEIRNALIAFLRQVNGTLVGRGLSAESRRLTLLKALSDQVPAIVGILKAFVSGVEDNDLFRAQLAAAADSLVNDAMQDARPSVGPGTNTAVVTGTLVTMPVTTATNGGMILVPIQNCQPFHCLFPRGPFR